MSHLFPVFLDISGKKVVVIGGGHVASRKIDTLLERNARILLISPPPITDRLQELEREKRIDVLHRPYQSGDLQDAWLVIAATDNADINRQVFDEAQEKRIFCNVVDVPSLCSFQVPSVLRRGDLQVAVSTAGVSPALARRIRLQLEELFGEYYEIYLQALAELRVYVKEKYPDDQLRRSACLEGFVDSPALELLRKGKVDEFHQIVEVYKQII